MNTPASSHQTSRGVLGATIPENDVHVRTKYSKTTPVNFLGIVSKSSNN
jgi:hypothetical protein